MVLKYFIELPNGVGTHAEQDQIFLNCIYPVNFWLVFGFTDPVTCYNIGIVKLSVSKPNTKFVNDGDQ